MKHTTFDISFYCRESKTNRQGLAPVEMSIIINGERCIVTLPRKEVPSEFKRAWSSKRDNDIKQYLQAVRAKIGEIQTEMLEKDIPLTASMLRDYFRTGGIQHYSIEDLFIFQVNSGLSYCDMAILIPEDYQVTEQGLYYIHKQRMKTHTFFTAVVFPDGVDILRRYGFVLPILSNQKYNAYLKQIADLCNITKPLHTHVARHTYATLCLNRGVRVEVVAKLSGHSTTKVTAHYAKFIQSTIISEVNEAFSLAIELTD